LALRLLIPLRLEPIRYGAARIAAALIRI
jgi:hypothetical protein